MFYSTLLKANLTNTGTEYFCGFSGGFGFFSSRNSHFVARACSARSVTYNTFGAEASKIKQLFGYTIVIYAGLVAITDSSNIMNVHI